MVSRAAYDLARYHRRRAEAIQRLGGACVDCGTAADLQFDHVDPSTKQFDISKSMLHGDTKLNEELKKCVLRCKQCHHIRSVAQSSVEHGGGLTGKKNCRCDLCGPLKSRYIAEYRRRQREQGIKRRS